MAPGIGFIHHVHPLPIPYAYCGAGLTLVCTDYETIFVDDRSDEHHSETIGVLGSVILGLLSWQGVVRLS